MHCAYALTNSYDQPVPLRRVMERLGLARKRLVKVQKLTSQTMTSRDDAGKLFRPYLSQETAVAAAPVAAAAAPVAAAA